MSRHRPSGSYGHRIQRIGDDWFRLSWVVDRYYTGSRLRFPRGTSRDTDLAGARRFAKRWELPEPHQENTPDKPERWMMDDTVTIPVELAQRAIAALHDAVSSEDFACSQSAYTAEHWAASGKLIDDWRDIADKLEAAIA